LNSRRKDFPFARLEFPQGSDYIFTLLRSLCELSKGTAQALQCKGLPFRNSVGVRKGPTCSLYGVPAPYHGVGFPRYCPLESMLKEWISPIQLVFSTILLWKGPKDQSFALPLSYLGIIRKLVYQNLLFIQGAYKKGARIGKTRAGR